MGSYLRVGEVLRSSRAREPSVETVDGYPNIHHRTASRILAPIQLSKGINPIAEVKVANVARRPAVLIRSSPWKAGSVETPWHDEFDLDNGRVVYFGDHRVDHTVPVGETQGNKVLRRAWASHCALSVQERTLAAPLLVFATVTRNKTPKGYVKFCGLAVIGNVEEMEQTDRGRPFPNFRYELALLDLSAEDDRLNWAWIEARGNQSLSTDEALERAPRSWQRWVEGGSGVLPQVRQRPLQLGEPRASPRSADAPADEGMLFPTPPQPRSRPVPIVVGDDRQPELTAARLMAKLRNLRAHQQNGRTSPHKPLTLMWAIARNARGEPRLSPWPTFRDEVGGLLVEFGHSRSTPTPEYPFWHLRTSGLWDVDGLSAEQASKISASLLNRSEPQAGLTRQADRLLSDPFVRSQAIAVLRETYFDDPAQHRLMEQLGLSGYENASGTEAPAEEQGQQGPAARRATHTFRVVRDVGLANKVKDLHADHCQVCGKQLATRFGTYSEAAHIRGLGQPHNGPDELANLLVLCPNHHVQFDTLAIYVDPKGIIRSTTGDRRGGELRRHPDHRISEAHLRYHRALCGRDIRPEPDDRTRSRPTERPSPDREA
ncbi:HNH endonuclease [Streptomyces sp. NPDC093085]|uniref:HNH endonuclease n=1 Tax=Streptomyces sp. NPDC093085 TaxID=3155068 RepID=UPI003434B276